MFIIDLSNQHPTYQQPLDAEELARVCSGEIVNRLRVLNLTVCVSLRSNRIRGASS